MKSRTLLLIGIAIVASLGALHNGCVAPPPGSYSDQRNTQSNEARNKDLGPRDDFEKGKATPITADTHFAAGQFAETQGNPTQAIEQYRKALKLNPKHKSSLFRLAVIHVKEQHFPEAVATWEKYVIATNGDATAYANLGFALELSGRTNEAEQVYLKGIRREAKNAACRTNYGLMLARRERFNEAILQFQVVLSEADVHYNLASVYEALGRNEQAKIEYKNALNLDPKMKDAQARLDALQ